MIKSIVFYVSTDQFGATLLQANFAIHDEAINFINNLNGKKGISQAVLVSAQDGSALRCLGVVETDRNKS